MRGEYSYLLGKSAKINKSDEYTNYDSYIMYLAPHKVSGFNVCPNASEGCAAACLNTSGMGRFESTQSARINRTLHFVHDKLTFFTRLCKEVEKLNKKHAQLALRLNGTSDINFIPFINKLHGKFPSIKWYDYTKNPKIAEKSLDIPHYHVTFSRSENNENACMGLLKNGVNVAAVFNKKLPARYKGYSVLDGDTVDARFLDPAGVIVGLRAKGKAKCDNSGFVINI